MGKNSSMRVSLMFLLVISTLLCFQVSVTLAAYQLYSTYTDSKCTTLSQYYEIYQINSCIPDTATTSSMVKQFNTTHLVNIYFNSSNSCSSSSLVSYQPIGCNAETYSSTSYSYSIVDSLPSPSIPAMIWTKYTSCYEKDNLIYQSIVPCNVCSPSNGGGSTNATCSTTLFSVDTTQAVYSEPSCKGPGFGVGTHTPKGCHHNNVGFGESYECSH